jgi:hypothetical protein
VTDPYRCYQTREGCYVVHQSDFDEKGDPQAATVRIDRAPGDPLARMLMRVCAAILNGDEFAALGEIEALADRRTTGEENQS